MDINSVALRSVRLIIPRDWRSVISTWLLSTPLTMEFTFIALITFLSIFAVEAIPPKNLDLSKIRKLADERFDGIMHTIHPNSPGNQVEHKVGQTKKTISLEEETDYWYRRAEETLQKKLGEKLNTNVAKNIIFYLGDGMSVPTLMAARTYQGQLNGNSGEEDELYWEKFPFAGLSKTWCLDYQVPDSACTSTAYMTGVKTNLGTLGINGHVRRGDCSTQNNETNHVDSILKWAQDQGKSSGFVTTTRVTHASPSGGYAHAADRDWEHKAPKGCMDIAAQLVTQDPGKNFKVIMGGGRRGFLPKTMVDEESEKGSRSDRRNLIEEWKKWKASRGEKYLYGWNKTMVHDIIRNPEKYDSVLGLFKSSHMDYHLEANEQIEPTLSEMTEAAIKVLRKNKEGFVLFVEGGRIDHAHHDSQAHIALDETVELAKAVKTGRESTSPDDTLIIVTSDHAHTMSIAGYPPRGHKIQGMSPTLADDGLPYMTLSYANGPGYQNPQASGLRHNLLEDNIDDTYYRFPALVPLEAETHGGDDVAIFSSGPWAHLFTGTIEQSSIPHLLAYASCLSSNSIQCKNLMK